MTWSHPPRGVEIENAGHRHVADLPISIQRLMFAGWGAHDAVQTQNYCFMNRIGMK